MSPVGSRDTAPGQRVMGKAPKEGLKEYITNMNFSMKIKCIVVKLTSMCHYTFCNFSDVPVLCTGT